MWKKIAVAILALALAMFMEGSLHIPPSDDIYVPDHLLLPRQTGIGLGEHCYADIDYDGIEELINITYFGSGICVIQIDVYKENQWYASASSLFGYMDLALEKVNEHTVKLRGRRETDDGYAFTKDFGKLTIRQIGNRRWLEPEIDPQPAIRTAHIDEQMEYIKEQTAIANTTYDNPTDDARARIADWLRREVPGFNMASLSELQETDLGIEHLYELTETQFFSLGIFLYVVHHGEVSRFRCLSLRSALAEDLDGDGADEVVLLCDNGSGRYLYQLLVVKDGAVYDRTLESVSFGTGYRLDTMCSSGVQLLRVEYEGGQETGSVVVGQVGLRDGQVLISFSN